MSGRREKALRRDARRVVAAVQSKKDQVRVVSELCAPGMGKARRAIRLALIESLPPEAVEALRTPDVIIATQTAAARRHERIGWMLAAAGLAVAAFALWGALA